MQKDDEVIKVKKNSAKFLFIRRTNNVILVMTKKNIISEVG